MAKVKPRTVTGSQLVTAMRSQLDVAVEKYTSQLEVQPYGEYRIEALRAAQRDDSELGVLSLLPSRTISDTIWKPAVRDQFLLAGHTVIDCDDQDQDTRECSHRREYKAARQAGNGRYTAMNSTRNPRVLIDLFVADGRSFADSGIYTLTATDLESFVTPARHGRGWQLSLTSEQLRDPDGFGAYRLSFAEYSRRRMSACRC
jgi:hypothetical protein